MDQTALSAYQEHGFEDRKAYRESLAEDNGGDYRIVREVALKLGPTEDFDGLVVAIEDYSCSGW